MFSPCSLKIYIHSRKPDKKVTFVSILYDGILKSSSFFVDKYFFFIVFSFEMDEVIQENFGINCFSVLRILVCLSSEFFHYDAFSLILSNSRFLFEFFRIFYIFILYISCSKWLFTNVFYYIYVAKQNAFYCYCYLIAFIRRWVLWRIETSLLSCSFFDGDCVYTRIW